MLGTSARPFSFTFQTMGTLGHVSVSSQPDTDSASDEELRQVLIGIATECDRRMSVFRGDSDVYRLDRGSDDSSQVSLHTERVSTAAEALSRETRGFFSARLRRQMQHWHNLANAIASVDPGPTRETFDPGTDFGGIAKGYAADLMRDRAVQMGRADVLVSLGGSSIAVAGEPARIALASPWDGWDRIGILTLPHGSLSVSASPQTPITDSPHSLHILDPHTGRPAVSDLCLAAVWGADGMKCEAFSTAYLAMGLNAAVDLDQCHDDVDAVFATVDGRLMASSRLDLRTSLGLSQWLHEQRHRRL